MKTLLAVVAGFFLCLPSPGTQGKTRTRPEIPAKPPENPAQDISPDEKVPVGYTVKSFVVKLNSEEAELDFFQGETSPAMRSIMMQFFMIQKTLQESTEDHMVIFVVSVYTNSGACFGYCAEIPEGSALSSSGATR